MKQGNLVSEKRNIILYLAKSNCSTAIERVAAQLERSRPSTKIQTRLPNMISPPAAGKGQAPRDYGSIYAMQELFREKEEEIPQNMKKP